MKRRLLVTVLAAGFILMIPLPGIFVDTFTGSFMQWISATVVEVLSLVGFPISRAEAVIAIGQYQMLVADAGSGVSSMFSLSALGLLFMYVQGRKHLLHNAIMFASVLPIAFAANVVSVMLLVLITYKFGEWPAMGFLHGQSDVVRMLVTLLLLFALDLLLERILPPRFPPPPMPEPVNAGS